MNLERIPNCSPLARIQGFKILSRIGCDDYPALHTIIMARFWPEFNLLLVKDMALLWSAIAAAARRFNYKHIACAHINFVRVGQFDTFATRRRACAHHPIAPQSARLSARHAVGRHAAMS